MSLQPFSFPFPETRFFRAGRLIYKFKIRAGSSYSGEEMVGGNFCQELEDTIRTVLGNLDNLHPFSSTHFIIFPYKQRWEGMSKVMCKHSQKKLSAYPFVLILYVEKNTQNEKQAEELSPSKRCKRRSPVEDATLKGLSEDIEADREVSVVRLLNVNNPHAETVVQEDAVDKKEINPQLQSGDSTVTGSGSPGKVEPQTMQDEEGEQQFGEEEEITDSGHGTPSGSSGVLSRLASYMFPFSWFYKDP
ncbi:membrane-anchored junction protein isoform X2 [Anabas testudineus]|uniref:membrane-anchored junction protein isoform X2 n=1 Tax=Anabas testudineus TaxID=64144 RepID=UPI000E455C90|nr:membrane-anchored junction protein isoform X2 [Anabas testudineus]